MKYRVIGNFRDRYTGELCTTGQVLELTAVRAAEVNSAAGGPFVEKIAAKKKAEG